MDVVLKSRRVVRYEVSDQEERPWGNWRVVDAAASFVTRRVEVEPGHRLSLQFHKHHSEHWVIVAGKGEPTVGDSKIDVAPGDHVVIPLRGASLHPQHR
jgi:mannose-6-phosphate isomerase